jgi:hypothetical protein
MSRTAEDLYSEFTAFQPDRAFVHWILWPDRFDLCLLGYATGISYRSDKWEGIPTDYIHTDITPVQVLAPKIDGYPPSPEPPDAPPGFEFAMLGYKASHCLDLHFIDAIDGSSRMIDFLQAALFPWIAAHPDGHTLIICYAGQLPIIVTGPGLEVTHRGIVG